MEKHLHTSTPAFSQRPGSSMTIDTNLAQNAYAAQQYKKQSLSQTQQQLRRRSVYSSEPIMSPDELTSKIADNFQQFSSMLNQLQKSTPHSPALSRPTTPILNRLSRPNSIDNKHTRRFSLKDDDLNGKTTMCLPSPVSMVSPLPPLLQPTTKHTIPKRQNTMATQDKPLVTKFLRAASNGDTRLVETLVQQCGDLVYGTDAEDGTAALSFAACFGHSSTVKSLLQAGAPIDQQDQYGWTALMWATVNHHDSVVALLLSQGAVQDTRSLYGTMVFDLVHDHHSVTATLLNRMYSRRYCSTMDRMEKRKKNKQLLKASRRQSTPIITGATSPSLHCQSPTTFQHSGGMDAYTHFMTTESEHLRRLTQRHELFYDALLTLKHGSIGGGGGGDTWTSMCDMNADDDDDDGVGTDNDTQLLENYKATNRPFSWDSCFVDQMFVFSMDDLDTILDVALDTKSVPRTNNNKDDILWAPADILFLCARFVCYYSNRAALRQFLDVTIGRIARSLKQCSKDTSLLQYWLANIYQLLVYLQRDVGLERNTVQQQQQLADLVTEVYILQIRGYERQLDKMIASQILDYESIEGMASVDFEDANDWSTFFQRRGSIRMSMDSLSGAGASGDVGGRAILDLDSNESIGPHAITAALERIHIVMATVYDFPGYMVKHVIMQCLYYVLCEGFNQILECKTYLCRSKAQNIRMNLTILEEWARQMGLLDNTYCMTGFDRLAQLLQLLQCISELDDLDAFKGICRGLTLLNAAHIKQCAIKYRYETQETHLPTYVEDWVVQQASQLQQRQQQRHKQATLDQNIHMHQLKGILLGQSNQDGRDNKNQVVVGGLCIDLLLVDSHWILPFYQDHSSGSLFPSLSTHKGNNSCNQQDTLSEPMYLEIKEKAKRDKKQPFRVPSLPYKFIERLDKKLNK